MILKNTVEKIKQKSPAFVGFFSFLIPQVLFFYSLQLVSRVIFIFHRSTRESSVNTFLDSTYYGFPLDISMTCYFIIFILLLYLVVLLINRYTFLYIAIVFVVLITILVCLISFADAEMYRVWGSKFNRQALDFLRKPTEAMASSSEAAWIRILIYTACISALSFLIYRKLIQKSKTLLQYGRRWQIPLVLIFICIAGILARGGLGTIPISQSIVYYSDKNFRNLAAVNSAWNCMYFFVEKPEEINPENYRFDIGDGEFWKQYIQGDSSRKNISKTAKPNIVIVVLESFSAYASKLFGKVHDNMPFLDSLGRTGWAFSNAYSQGDRTPKGIGCIIGGWPGQPWQSILLETDKAARLPSLTRVFNEKGYQSSFYYGGDLSFANMRAYIRNAGFTSIIEEIDFPKNQRNSKWGAHDEYLLDRFIDDKRNCKQPFFSTVLTLSSHEPYEVPGVAGIDFENEYSKFLKAIKYTDDCLQRMIQRATKEAWFSNTIFVFVADHGRDVGLPDMGYSQPKHFHIPIIFWGPALADAFKGKMDSTFSSQTDIGATLTTNLFGTKAGYFPFGRNLAGKHANMTAYFFDNGFGVVSPQGHVIWENQPPRLSEKAGTDIENLTETGKALQYELVKRYKNN